MNERELISKIANIDSEIHELVPESKLPELNRLLDKSSDLYRAKIAELEVKLTSANNIIKIMYMGDDDD